MKTGILQLEANKGNGLYHELILLCAKKSNIECNFDKKAILKISLIVVFLVVSEM